MIAYLIARILTGSHAASRFVHRHGTALFVIDAIVGHFTLKAINAPVLVPALKTASMLTGHDLTGLEY